MPARIPAHDRRRDELWAGVAAAGAAPLVGAILTLIGASALDAVAPRVTKSPSYDLDTKRTVDPDDPGRVTPLGRHKQELTDACWIPMRTGRVLRRYEDTGVVEEVDLTGQKRPSVDRVMDPGTLARDVENTFEPKCRDDDVVGCCFIQETATRFARADDRTRILKRYGARPKLGAASSVPALLFLYVLGGAIVALLTRRASSGRVLLGCGAAGLVQLAVWASSMDWGVTGAFFQPMAVGAWVAPAGAMLALVVPLGVALAAATGATVTSIVDRAEGIHRCGSCDALTDAAEPHEVCSTCGARRSRRVPRFGLAAMAAVAVGFVFTLLVVALGRATSTLYVCPRPMDAVCTLALAQHDGLTRVDFVDSVILHDWIRYGLVTAPAFLVVPFLVGRFVKGSRGAALVAVPLAVVVATLAALFFVLPELSQVSFTVVFQLHLRVVAIWLVAGGVGAALGSRLRGSTVREVI